MARYSVVIRAKAEAEFRAIPFPFRRQLNQLIYKLSDDPRLPGSKLIEGALHQVTAHGWLVLYEVDDETQDITIVGFQKAAAAQV